MEKVNVTCRIPRDAVESLDKLGALVDRDRTYLVNQAIDHYLAHQKWQIEEVERAIAEADAGQTVSHKEFVKEVKSWR